MKSLRPPPDPARVKRILIRSTNWIGDVVMISPALAALRRRYASARIEIVAIPQVAPCLQANPAIDEVLLFDRRGVDRGAAGMLRLVKRLRERRYDMAVLFQKAIGAALAARLAGIPIRVGLDTDRRAALLTHPVPFAGPLSRHHHLEVFSEIAKAAGCEEVEPRPFFPLVPADLEWADRFLADRGAGRFRLLLALHGGASKPPRAWHAERFAEAASSVADRHGAGVVILGSRDDRPAMSIVAERLGERALNACGDSTIGQMAALISRCRVFVGNDSGPMHVAGALGVPVVAIFGPGDPARTAPWPGSGGEGSGQASPGGAVAARAGVIAVSKLYPCAPCRQAFFEECYPAPSGKPMCLESIPTGEVEAAIERLLRDGAAAGTS